MSVAFYASESVYQIILFRLCVKCGRFVRFNEICECENAGNVGGKSDDAAVSERPRMERPAPEEVEAICGSM